MSTEDSIQKTIAAVMHTCDLYAEGHMFRKDAKFQIEYLITKAILNTKREELEKRSKQIKTENEQLEQVIKILS